MGRSGQSDTAVGDLLARATREPEAFGAFYDRFEEEVLGFFYRATRRADLAADLTAETFAAALVSARNFDPELGPVRGWLFGIARHQLADARERQRVEDRARRRLGLEPLALTDDAIERIEQLGGGTALTALELMERLPEDQHMAVRGRIVEERDYADLAATLQCSESVVRQRVSRGLRALRRRLESTR